MLWLSRPLLGLGSGWQRNGGHRGETQTAAITNGLSEICSEILVVGVQLLEPKKFYENAPRTLQNRISATPYASYGSPRREKVRLLPCEKGCKVDGSGTTPYVGASAVVGLVKLRRRRPSRNLSTDKQPGNQQCLDAAFNIAARLAVVVESGLLVWPS
jgi:hypothetical protein